MKKRTALLLGGLVAAVSLIVLRKLDSDPPHADWLDERDSERGVGAYEQPTRNVESTRLLVTARVDAPEPPSFEKTDWSAAWVNLFEQEFGHFAHLDVSELDAADFEEKRLICLTRSAQGALGPEARAALERFVERGGTLILDRPRRELARLAKIRLTHEPREWYGTWFVPQALTGELNVDELRQQVSSTYCSAPLTVHSGMGSARERLTLFERDGERIGGGIWSNRVGEGLVVALGFDLGKLLVTVQQGAPEDDFRFGKTIGFYDWVLESHDLVSLQPADEVTLPIADTIERRVLDAIREERPIPTWWAFPDLAPGAFLMTHDEDMQSAASCDLLLEHELRLGIETTYLLIPFPRMIDLWSEGDVERYVNAGADLQLHWNRLPMPTGVWKVEPFERVFSLESQLDMLVERLGARPEPLINRNHYLAWESLDALETGDTDWARTFRVMCEQRVDLDTTYGPNRGGRGYLFGTGRPFRPLDNDGTLLPILELPFVAQEDWGGETEEWWRSLLRESRDFYHCAITCIIHPHLIVREPAGNALWKTMHRLANEADHVSLTLAEYWRFLEARRESSLFERVGGDGVLAIDVDARVHGMALDFRARSDVRYEVNGREVDGSPISVDRVPHVLIPVPEGPSTVRVIPTE